MIPKQKGCHGCPAEHRGAFMVPDDSKPTARVRVVAQNPGEAEVLGRRFVRWYKGEEGTGEIWEQDVPRPLIGKSGHELDKKFLPLAGLTRDDVECTNVVRCRLNNSNDLPPLTTTMAREMVTHCQRAYWKEPRDEQTLVALGAYALWALTGEYEGDDDDADAADDDLRASRSVDGWRGWMLDYKPQHRVASGLDGGRRIIRSDERKEGIQPVRDRNDNRSGYGPEGSANDRHESVQGNLQASDREQAHLSHPRDGWQSGGNYDDTLPFHGSAAEGTDTASAGRMAELSACETERRISVEICAHVSNSVKVFVSYHPAFYWRAHWLRAVGKSDFARLGRYLRGTWPEAFPQMQQYAPTLRPFSMAFDTEYNPWTRELHRFSLAWRDPVDWHNPTGETEPQVFVVEAVEQGPPIGQVHNLIMQNAEADWPYITSIFGALPKNWEDTMYAHAVLYGTLRHSLDFMGSLYARHNRWKHLQQSDPLTYSGMDALATYDIWTQLSRELARDPLSLALYERELKPLLPHVMVRPSVRLNAMHIASAAQELEAEQQQIAQRGAAVAGWPLNVSSADQVSRWLRLKSDPQ